MNWIKIILEFFRDLFSEPENPEDIICPVCGYYCLGRGGFGCIDKPWFCDQAKKEQEK